MLQLGEPISGQARAAAARQQEIPIRALTRDIGRLPVPADVVVRFDFADRTTYAHALDAVRTLVLISPGLPRQAEKDAAVIDAARAAGVAHIIRLSAARADEAATRFGAQHHAVEQHIRASGLAWTFVRPTFFMENILGLAAPIAAGTYPAPIANARMTQVAATDIAAVLLENPLVWMIQVDGFLVGVRTMPPEIQEEARRLGLVPEL